MFQAIAKASAELHKIVGDKPADMETIVRVAIGTTAIDKIIFVEYDAKPTNPVWGSFQRWVARPAPYTPLDNWVEIRYASHLDRTWRKFVVCKEISHALEDDDGCHSVTAGAMDNLVNAFSLRSKNKPAGKVPPPITAETLAEAAAIELLCPMPVRRAIVASGTEDFSDACAKYGIPEIYDWFAFGSQWIDAVEGFLKRKP